MKYFVVITLMICVIGVSSVFAAGQTKAATSNLVITAQTVQTMVKNTVKYVKYVVPIESMIVVVSFLLSMVFRPFLKLCKSEYENSQIFEYSLNPWKLLSKVP